LNNRKLLLRNRWKLAINRSTRWQIRRKIKT